VVSLLFAGAACQRKGDQGGASSTGDILIGEYGSLSGEGASFGRSSKEGIELAVDEINDAGGLLGGRKLRILLEDDQSKPDEAATVVTKLITKDKVVAVLGEVASSRSLAGAEICQQYKIPMITPSSTNEKVTAIGDYIFRVCFIDPFQGEVMAKFANQMGIKRVAIMKDIKQDYSVGLSASFEKSFKGLGGEIATIANYSTGDADFKAPLTSIRSLEVEAIYIPGYYNDVGLIVRQARELGMKVPILGGDGWVGDTLWQTGREALANCYISNHYSADDPSPAVQKFVQAYKARFNREPDSIAALAYDATKVLADAITRAGTTESAKLRDALASTKLSGVTGSLNMNAKRDVNKPAIVQELKYENGQGRYVYKTTIMPSGGGEEPAKAGAGTGDGQAAEAGTAPNANENAAAGAGASR
jgi:branched-chain amino acid transport system substrate-binding protein